MRKYTFELLKTFKELCEKGPNNTARQRIALGRAIVVEAGIDLKEYTGTKASPLFSDIASAFHEMIEKEWLRELSLDHEKKTIGYSDYKNHITKSGLTHSSDFDYMRNRLRVFPWPLGDHWFLLTAKGEEFIKKQNLIGILESLRSKGKELLELTGQNLARQQEIKGFLDVTKKELKEFLPPDEIPFRKFEKLEKKTYWWEKTQDGFATMDDKSKLQEWLELIEECLIFYSPSEMVLGIDFSPLREFQDQLANLAKSFKLVSIPNIPLPKETIEQFCKTSQIISEEFKKINFVPVREVLKSMNASLIANSTLSLEKLAREATSALTKFKEASLATAAPFKALEHMAYSQKNLLDNYLSYLQPIPQPVKVEPLETKEKDKLDVLLNKINPALKKKRTGAWDTFRSDNPDKLSQAANSMVELLSQVLNSVCKGKKLGEFLKEKYKDDFWEEFSKEEAKWIDATVEWISKTKNNLERVKHHIDYRLENIAETLLINCERIILIIVE